jgi:hypothetical protein
VPAVPESTVREGVPHPGHLEGAGRHRRRRLRLVHRLPLLHVGLPVRRAPLQLGGPEAARGRAEPEPALPRQPSPPEGRRREVHLLHPADAQRPLPGVRRGLPGGRTRSSTTSTRPSAEPFP